VPSDAQLFAQIIRCIIFLLIRPHTTVAEKKKAEMFYESQAKHTSKEKKLKFETWKEIKI
jgi:hypothetical protein